MVGPLIPFTGAAVINFKRAIDKMGGPDKVLEKIRKGAGGFRTLQRLMEERTGERRPGDLITNKDFQTKRLEKSKGKMQATELDKQAKLDKLLAEGPGSENVDKSNLLGEAEEELLAKLSEDQRETLFSDLLDEHNPAEESAIDFTRRRANELLRGGLSKDVFDASVDDTDATIRGDFDKQGNLIEQSLRGDGPKSPGERAFTDALTRADARLQGASTLVEERLNPKLVDVADSASLSDDKTAELLSQRTGIFTRSPRVESGSNFVVENLVDNSGQTFGTMKTNPVNGRTEIVVSASDGEPFDNDFGGTTGFAFPFASRAEAYDGLAQLFNEGIAPNTFDLEEFFTNSVLDLENTNIDDFMLSNDK